MATIASLTLDRTATVEGRWFTFLQDVELKLASWNNPEMLAWYREQTAPLHEEHGDDIPNELLLPITKEAVATFIVRGIKGLKFEDDGSDIEYSPTNIMELFEIEDFGSELFSWVMRTSKQRANFRGAHVARAAGN